MKKPWSGRFKQSTDQLMEKFSASISFDRRLYTYDIAGSIAHCQMLAKCKIISQTDSKKIIGGFKFSHLAPPSPVWNNPLICYK